MEILQETTDITKRSFMTHVFSMTEENNAEVMNVIQYAIMGLVPVVLLNKSIQKFIPDADPDNSSLELLVEIAAQLVVMFCGIILIHRMITYVPTYSGFKYESLCLTSVILAFLVIVLSIQTKLGLKVNILVDRALELWNGPSAVQEKEAMTNNSNVRVKAPVSSHAPSQADYLDNSAVQPRVFPPAPSSTTQQNTVMESYDHMTPGGGQGFPSMMEPSAANLALGGSFGSAF